ncbi:hypothetical protein [Methylobacterium phyllostachyos]|uniref:hypothetical protein n=1 Tax=Methylobacterium phyllostachyos TaxID=582672 RepID=UPI003CC7A1CD
MGARPRDKHWMVLRVPAEVIIPPPAALDHGNEAVYLPMDSIQRPATLSQIPLELIEFQIGSCTGEGDLISVEDIDGRQSANCVCSRRSRWPTFCGAGAEWEMVLHVRPKATGCNLMTWPMRDAISSFSWGGIR